MDDIQLPKGGRGHKAPYQTRTIRVPVPCLDGIEKLVAGFHLGINDLNEKKILSKEEAELIADKILNQKKSAKISIEKLLTAIYG